MRQLLDVFWATHDPTQVNRQGPDYGTQYRTVIFYHDDEQKAEAEASKQFLDQSGRFPRPIATQIVPAGPFYRAEEYHQRIPGEARAGELPPVRGGAASRGTYFARPLVSSSTSRSAW